MTADSDAPRQMSPAALEFDRAATRLSVVLDASCDLDLTFAEQLDASLSATVGLLASDPQLAELLAPDLGQPDLATSCGVWIKIYARRLRLAAERSPRPLRHPEFVEPFLIAGISAEIRRSLDFGSLQDPGLLAGLKEFILAYYTVTAAGAAPAESRPFSDWL
jgi:hypothetical protein